MTGAQGGAESEGRSSVVAESKRTQTRIRLCGPMMVEIEGARVTPPGRQGRMLLAYLLANRARPARRDELIEVIWEGSQPSSPEASLNVLLSRARSALGEGRLDSRQHISLRLPPDAWIDREAIDEQAAGALEALGRGQASHALRLARASLELMEAELLPGLEGSWIDERRRDLDDLRLSMSEVSVEASLMLGGVELPPAERAARLLVERAPYRESGYALLMRVHAARGDAAEAIRVYDRLRTLLREELGTAPGPDVTALNERLLRQEELGPPAGAARPEQRVPPQPSVEEIALPPVLDSASAEAFVGREEPLARLSRRWSRASVRPRVVALTGEPGIGKTRLAACFAEQVCRDGATVLYGRCDEDPLTSYQPLVEGIDHYLRHTDLDRLAAELPAEAAELHRLPALGARLAAGGYATGPSGEGDRLLLFEAIAAVLSRAAGVRPLLVVVDDLHWTDGPTFQLILHLLRRLDPVRSMFLVTFRDVDAGLATGTGDDRSTGSLESRLAALRREAEVERLCLEGLDERATGALIAARGDAASGEGLSRRLKQLTGGNPFFMTEALRGLSERRLDSAEPDLDDLGIPEGVREVVTRRLDRLDHETSEVVATASVIGPEFDLGLLESIVDQPPSAVLDAVEELVGAGLLVEIPTKPDHFAFSHALVRESEYRRLLRSRRTRLHEQVGLELERRSPDGGAEPAELAHHFYEARSRVGAERAARHSIVAGDHASRTLAYEPAGGHYGRAIALLLEGGEGHDEHRLCEIRLSQGGALLRAGRVEDARRIFRAVAESARERRAVDQLARAALCFHGRYTIAGEIHSERIALLEEALAELDPADGGLRARVLARLADSLLWADEERARDLSCEAVAMARRVGDDGALLEALGGRHAALLHADHLDERLLVGRERLEVAEAAGDRETTASTLRWQIQDLCDRGAMRAAKERHARLARLAAELHQPLYLSYVRHWGSAFAQLHGRFGEADRLADEASALAERAGSADAEMQRVVKRLFIHREQGRLAAIRPAVERYAIGAPTIKAWQALLVLIDAELAAPGSGAAFPSSGRGSTAGFQAARVTAARAALDRLVADAGAEIPRDVFWLATLAALAEASAHLEYVAGAPAEIHRLLLPYEDQYVQVGLNVCLGSVSRFLGLAATASRSWEAADRHLRLAAERNEAIGSAPLLARTRTDHADMLLRRGDEADRDEAVRLLAAAGEAAESHGMVALSRRATALRARAGDAVAV